MAQKIKEVTVTGELKSKEGMLFRLEYRRDFSDIGFFLKDVGTHSQNQNTFTAAPIYAFSTKTP
jgi:Putative beta-barrel porin-2, OmpL-like. bbp2